MMRNFTDEDFDEFLRRNADEFRMRPSLKVWQNISGQLSKRRRRFLLTTIGFVLMTGAVGYFVYDGTENLDSSFDLVNSETSAPVNGADKSGNDKTISTQNKLYSVPSTRSSLITEKTSDEVNRNSIAVNRSRNVLRPLRSTDKIENTTSLSTLSNVTESEFIPQVIDSDPVPAEETAKPLLENSVAVLPLTIESVINSYRLRNGNGKLAMQVFFTPTVSYRKLSENKRYTSQPAASNGTNYPAIYSINDAVTHKPDMGLELGLTAKYALDKNLKLRGGLQFNVSRYDIKAYTYTSEIATIALGRSSSGGVDYIDEISSYRNFDGNKADWLQNMYFQVSAPMGVEMKLSGNDKASFGVASTLQPSYMLGERAYMLSSDYKNYTKVPELVRRWNVATNLETFVSYSTGDVKWQVGPQVRYQLFSSFVSKYPVKEHLFDFGLKVGVSLNKKKTESEIK
jgi:hypothetical protein